MPEAYNLLNEITHFCLYKEVIVLIFSKILSLSHFRLEKREFDFALCETNASSGLYWFGRIEGAM